MYRLTAAMLCSMGFLAQESVAFTSPSLLQASHRTLSARSQETTMGLRDIFRAKRQSVVPQKAVTIPEETISLETTKPFDFGANPPFTLADVRNAIPNHLFKKDTGRSMFHCIKDVLIVAGLAAGAITLDNPLVWPLYWMAQGTMFWALFVVGHDCGHGSFSDNKLLNSIIGHLTHSSILVPYHGWRISHRTHHANHGHVHNDESWHPVTKSMYNEMEATSRLGRFNPLVMLIAFPFYLWKRSPGKKGSHFDPSSDLFDASEKKDVITSTTCYFAMLALLAGVGMKFGFLFLLKTYIVPYFIGVMWLDIVTFLHHTSIDVPWYRDPEWSYFRGGLSTRDRDYGIFNKIHHDIGTHVVHHLFPQIPHYNLCEATEAVKPVMGEYYVEPEKSKLLPVHLLKLLWHGFKNCQVVEDEGTVVYYEPIKN